VESNSSGKIRLEDARHLIDTLCKRQDIHMWISNASLEDLCANRYLLTLILDRNPELSVSLRDRLERIDMYRVFEFLYFSSFEFPEAMFYERISKGHCCGSRYL
jgi:hypothetical protein